ncbi:MAG: hypothetical protein KGJ59_03800 [Bacteroidota bacterium]|nr:hypothetical protein [Bacteroidota bacterium]
MFLSRWRIVAFIRHNIKTFITAFKLRTSLERTFVWGAIVLVSLDNVFAGFERVVHSPVLWGKGLATAASRNIDAVLLNPASAAGTESFSISVFYSPSPFELPQLSNGGITAAVPLSSFAVCSSLVTSGFSLYRELSGTVTIANSFFGTLDVGANLSLNHLSIARYGSAAALTFDAGAELEVGGGVRWGVALLNCTRSTIGRGHDALPQLYLTGFEYTVLPRATVAFDIVKDFRYPFSIRAGTQFSPLESLDARFGVSSAPSRYYAGFGLRAMSLYVSYSVATHPELGLTHDIGIAFQF